MRMITDDNGAIIGVCQLNASGLIEVFVESEGRGEAVILPPSRIPDLIDALNEALVLLAEGE